MISSGGITFNYNNPGDMISKSYGTTDRFGIGQYNGGIFRIFGSTVGSPTVRISKPSDSVTTGSAAFTDYVTVKLDTGYVGIGTTNPSTALHVNGTVTANILVAGGGSANSVRIDYRNDSAKNFLLYSDSGLLYFYNSESGNNRMSLTNSGNLNVFGGITCDGQVTFARGLWHKTPGENFGRFYFDATTTYFGSPNSSYQWRGNTDNTLMTLANGFLSITGSLTQNSSDARLKTNIRNIDNALVKLDKIRGVYYYHNELAATYGFSNDEQQVGVLAQEFQEVFPEVVKPAPFDTGDNGGSKSGENYLTVQYEKIVPLLINAIKEQQVQIEELKQLVYKNT
jgi:hypothetical protein